MNSAYTAHHSSHKIFLCFKNKRLDHMFYCSISKKTKPLMYDGNSENIRFIFQSSLLLSRLCCTFNSSGFTISLLIAAYLVPWNWRKWIYRRRKKCTRLNCIILSIQTPTCRPPPCHNFSDWPNQLFNSRVQLLFPQLFLVAKFADSYCFTLYCLSTE